MSDFIDRLAKAAYDRAYPERENWAAIGGMDREDYRVMVEEYLAGLHTLPGTVSALEAEVASHVAYKILWGMRIDQ